MMQIGEYAVEPTNEKELKEFLEFNNFQYNSDFENLQKNSNPILVINIIKRFYFYIDKFFVYPRISEEEFYEKVNYYPNDVIYKKLFTEDSQLLYEGYTANGKPYGLGKLYFDNGNIYQEGVFTFKGIKFGKEHYYSGQVKFEGEYSITTGYGPNAPRIGNVFNEDGELTFTGKFEIKKGGVGFPMIKHPKNYRNNEKHKPEIEYISGIDIENIRLSF